MNDDKTDRTVKTFATKGDATRGGALEKAIGLDGGSVKIQKLTQLILQAGFDQRAEGDRSLRRCIDSVS